MLKKTIKNINGLDISINYSTSNKRMAEKKKYILLLHGFPELGFSFRYLIKILSSKGYFCIAPDQRGYGYTKFKTKKEENLQRFSVLNLAKDMYLLLKELKIDKVDIIGHDFGSYVSCYLTMLYPKIINSLVIMSMPFSGPPEKNKSNLLNMIKVNKDLGRLNPKRKHYQSYFCNVSAAKNMYNCKQGIFEFLRGYYYFKSHNYIKNKPHRLKNNSAREFSKLPEYYIMNKNMGMAETIKKYMPDKKQLLNCQLWLTDKDLKYYSKAFQNAGFKNPLKWYKMMLSQDDRNNILKENLPNTLNVPAIFIAGIADWGIYQSPGTLEKMNIKFFSNFFGIKLIKDAGHWVQQENPNDVAETLLNFYKNK